MWLPSWVVFHGPTPSPMTQPKWLAAVCVATVYSTVKSLSVPVTSPLGSDAYPSARKRSTASPAASANEASVKPVSVALRPLPDTSIRD